MSSPRAPALAAALAALVSAPSLRTGFQLDDHLHRAALLHLQPYARWIPSPWKLFTFFDGDAAHNAWLRDIGFLPWFSHPNLKIAFLRPVTIVTHLLDYALFPQSPVAMHLHSMVWYAALAALVAVLYRRIFARTAPMWVAGLAAVLYAVDDAHAVPASWLANRNATVASFFAVGALLLHDRAVRDRSKVALAMAPIALGLSLFAGETGVAAMAWLASYTIVLDPNRWKTRLLRAAPYVLVFAAWAVAWRLSGAGSSNSSIYSDPVRHPLEFLRVAPERVLLLVLGAFANAPTDLCAFVPWMMALMTVLGAIVLVAVVVAFRELVRTRPTARFFALGSLFALGPACAVVSSNRLLMLIGIGVFGLVAELAHVAATGFKLLFARVSLALHLAFAPFAFVVATHQFAFGGALSAKFVREIPADPSVATRDLVALNAAEPGALSYLAVQRAWQGIPAPRRTYLLSIDWHEVDVARIGDRALRLTPHGGFLEDPLSGLVRDPRLAIPVGQPIPCGPLTATVTRALPDGRPAEAVFEFDRSLEDPSLLFVKFDGSAFRVTSPPRVGETLTLPGTPLF